MNKSKFYLNIVARLLDSYDDITDPDTQDYMLVDLVGMYQKGRLTWDEFKICRKIAVTVTA